MCVSAQVCVCMRVCFLCMFVNMHLYIFHMLIESQDMLIYMCVCELGGGHWCLCVSIGDCACTRVTAYLFVCICV